MLFNLIKRVFFFKVCLAILALVYVSRHRVMFLAGMGSAAQSLGVARLTVYNGREYLPYIIGSLSFGVVPCGSHTYKSVSLLVGQFVIGLIF